MNDYGKLRKCFDEIGIEYYYNKNAIEIIAKDESCVVILFDDQGKYKEMV